MSYGVFMLQRFYHGPLPAPADCGLGRAISGRVELPSLACESGKLHMEVRRQTKASGSWPIPPGSTPSWWSSCRRANYARPTSRPATTSRAPSPSREDWLRENAIGRHSFVEVDPPVETTSRLPRRLRKPRTPRGVIRDPGMAARPRTTSVSLRYPWIPASGNDVC